MDDEVEAAAVIARRDADQRRQEDLRARRDARAAERGARIAARYERCWRAILSLGDEDDLPVDLAWYGKTPIDAWRSGDWRFRRFMNDHAPEV